ncbi:hypothetical protein [Rhodopirellula sp. P2]|uniref:hypothetical protein n=1 Tax=Rhodopirellula sp. P2 TaxID=2127060 RepID=UPI002367A1B1|nr:hypothetical protein [Rhodopirellula sp. P2]WDQ19150.1 hypothetical protein PSR62_11575 [Rhodopirellula sp. P2]
MLEPVSGQEASRAQLAAEGLIDEDQLVAEPIEMSSLPAPSQDVAELLQVGQVEFISGGPRPSETRGLRSPGFINREFDAETRFSLTYHFSSRCRWWWDEEGIVIRVRYPELNLKVFHEVWFRQRPNDLRQFWSSKLVQHELDHIRLSTDPRVLKRFETAVRSDESLRFSFSEVRSILGEQAVSSNNAQAGQHTRSAMPRRSSRLTPEQVRKLINERVRAHFDQTFQLIEIRYRELDRQTAHGSFAVPADGPLREWLDHSSAEQVPQPTAAASTDPQSD